MLTDKFGRHIDYLRLAVTDRCNLRCKYCMPAEGLDWVSRESLLSYEEMLVLLDIFHELGVTKLRFTGGEPFLRKDFMKLVEAVAQRNWFSQIAITTNGTLTAPHVARLKDLGIHSVNLSLDTMNEIRFKKITRRDDFAAVMETFEALLQHNIKTKINAVILEDINEEDLIELTTLTRTHPVDVRFIEEMPFNGHGSQKPLRWNHREIYAHIEKAFPSIHKLDDDPHSTSFNYQIEGHQGHVGIIPAYTRSFCGTCNRIRLTPAGVIKSCLYENAETNLMTLLRDGATKSTINQTIQKVVSHKAKDGFHAEATRSANPIHESMSTIGG
ncbi:MAG: GTP 3',8-cyclase MoaA [Flavobacteriales bacterium]|nr:GTP 3',8-cyclase MoaA [Flavobacteriales bacterium]